ADASSPEMKAVLYESGCVNGKVTLQRTSRPTSGSLQQEFTYGSEVVPRANTATVTICERRDAPRRRRIVTSDATVAAITSGFTKEPANPARTPARTPVTPAAALASATGMVHSNGNPMVWQEYHRPSGPRNK